MSPRAVPRDRGTGGRGAVTELYDRIGGGYARRRREDGRIAGRLREALGPAGPLLNVGAGAGAYEPRDRPVVAVEPSATMLAQRAPGAAPAVRARAEALPFRDGAFEAVLAVLTVHHWQDRARGLTECARVARGRVVCLTWDPESAGFWLVSDYFPEVLARDRRAFPTMAELRAALGPLDARPLPVPADCADGFLGAYWARPAAYLDPEVRAGISAFAGVADADPRLARLADDLATGRWARRHAALAGLTELDVGYRLVTAAGGAW